MLILISAALFIIALIVVIREHDPFWCSFGLMVFFTLIICIVILMSSAIISESQRDIFTSCDPPLLQQRIYALNTIDSIHGEFSGGLFYMRGEIDGATYYKVLTHNAYGYKIRNINADNISIRFDNAIEPGIYTIESITKAESWLFRAWFYPTNAHQKTYVSEKALIVPTSAKPSEKYEVKIWPAED